MVTYTSILRRIREPTAHHRVKPRSPVMRLELSRRCGLPVRRRGRGGRMQAGSKTSAECWSANTLFPIPDRRISSRICTVCFNVRLNRGGRVGLYRVRNISDVGMMLDTHSKLETGERVLIELTEP